MSFYSNKEDLSLVQPSQTGVTQDYVNTFAGVIQFVELYLNGVITFEEFISEVALREKYEERYPPSKYDNIITSKNSNLVSELNLLVEKINEILKNMKSKSYHNNVAQIEKEMNELNQLSQTKS